MDQHVRGCCDLRGPVRTAPTTHIERRAPRRRGGAPRRASRRSSPTRTGTPRNRGDCAPAVARRRASFRRGSEEGRGSTGRGAVGSRAAPRGGTGVVAPASGPAQGVVGQAEQFTAGARAWLSWRCVHVVKTCATWSARSSGARDRAGTAAGAGSPGRRLTGAGVGRCRTASSAHRPVLARRGRRGARRDAVTDGAEPASVTAPTRQHLLRRTGRPAGRRSTSGPPRRPVSSLIASRPPWVVLHQRKSSGGSRAGRAMKLPGAGV